MQLFHALVTVFAPLFLYVIAVLTLLATNRLRGELFVSFVIAIGVILLTAYIILAFLAVHMNFD